MGWEHKGGGRIDVFEKRTDWAGIIGSIIGVIALLAIIGAIAS